MSLFPDDKINIAPKTTTAKPPAPQFDQKPVANPAISDSGNASQPAPAHAPATAQAMEDPANHKPNYKVLARKYRPQKLAELIGQDALVRTLRNAITENRIPHAFILTGIRGVGKTSTARIIAKSLLCTGEDGSVTAPTYEPCGVCPSCVAITADKCIDVLEMDAATRTGVNDIRELIGDVKYLPVSGRYKVYIIDEVHMLSKSAFNALLKTLEEPPKHTKFIFATTEIKKVPVTVLSRCMRFDLPRVSLDVLSKHFSSVALSEGVELQPSASALVASLANGSVRDGLSILDQAISTYGFVNDNNATKATSEGGEAQEAQEIAEAQEAEEAKPSNQNIRVVTRHNIEEMAGVSDKSQIVELISHIFGSNLQESLLKVKHLLALGANADILISDLLEITHFIAEYQILGGGATSDAMFETESESLVDAIKKIASQLEKTDVTRFWQMLLKTAEEVKIADNPEQAIEMAIIRITQACGLPSIEKLLKEFSAVKKKVN